MLDSRTVVQLLNEDGIADRVKVEDLLSVALGVRPAALVMVPSELPDGPALGRAIDQAFSRSYLGIPPEGASALERLLWTLSTAVARMTRQPVAYKTYLVRDAFVRNVHRSPSFRALNSWAARMGLVLSQGQVRPTIDEIYMGRGRPAARLAFDVHMMRSRIRHRFLRQYRTEGGTFRVFPEEAHRGFLTHVGATLGYPDCCVERYVDLRERGEPVEQVAAAELAEHEPDPSAYFARDFIPCSPTCEAARQVGEQMLHGLHEIDPRLATLQRSAFADNVDRVRRLPDIIKERQERIQKKWEDMWQTGPGNDRPGPSGERR